MKICKAYTNTELLEALRYRDEVYSNIMSSEYLLKYDDEQLRVLGNLKKLTQFQRDLLYLTSQIGTYETAELYSVSASYLYRELKNIQKILHSNE